MIKYFFNAFQKRFFNKSFLPKFNPVKIRKILLLRSNTIGDMITFLPVAQYLKKKLPDSIITMAGTNTGIAVARHSKFIDNFLTIDFDILNSNTLKLHRFLAHLFGKKYDLVILSTADYNFKEMKYLTNTYTVSPEQENSGCFSYSVMPPADKSEIVRNLSIVENLFNNHYDDLYPEIYPLKKYDIDDLDEPYVVFHVGGKRLTRILPLDIQITSISKLVKTFGKKYKFILTGHGKIEDEIIGKITDDVKGVVSFSSKLDLEQLIYVLWNSSAVISNDTGIAHLAGALNKPQVVIWGPGDIKKWCPVNRNKQEIIYKSVDCSPCYLYQCDSMKCMNWIKPEDIVNALNNIL